MIYKCSAEMAEICGCSPQKVTRLARKKEIAALRFYTDENPSPVWLIADTEANRARLSVKAKTGRKTK